MSRSESDLLSDIASAITAIRSHLTHGPLSEALVMDAVAMRLLEIGEAVKALRDTTKATEPAIKWRHIAGMRDVLASLLRHSPRDHPVHRRQGSGPAPSRDRPHAHGVGHDDERTQGVPRGFRMRVSAGQAG